ncbi:MAG: GAF domain-containing protein [Desulfobacterales bacterium]|nr:GAF domain-containing protein [Desulfobacterales bacterium]
MTKVSEYCRERDPMKTIEVLFEIAQAVSRTLNLEELYREIHLCLGKILKVDCFYIALYDPYLDVISFPYHVDERQPAPSPGRKNTLIHRIIQEKNPLIFHGREVRRLLPETSAPVPQVWMGVPLMVKDRVIGAMVLKDYETPDTYLADDLELVNAISRHVALAIERKASEEKINEQQLLLEKILESSPMGIALVQNRIFKWVNQEMVRLFGYGDKSDFQDRDVRMIYRDTEDYETAGLLIRQSLVEMGMADYEMDLVRSDRGLFPAHIRLNCTGAEDPMAWTIATVTDISQRRAAEKETYERERLQGVLEMAGAVCHEINQPVQTILGYAELMLMGDEESNKDRLASIKSQAARIGQITQKLSNITRYKTVDYPGNTKIVDIWAAGDDSDYH